MTEPGTGAAETYTGYIPHVDQTKVALEKTGETEASHGHSAGFLSNLPYSNQKGQLGQYRGLGLW